MRCGVCSHPKRAAIEAAASGKRSNVLAVAMTFGVSESALAKHLTSHERAPRAKVSAAPKRASKVVALPKTRRRSAPPRSAPSPIDDEEEPAPETARSSRDVAAATARAALDGLLVEIRQLLRDVRDRDSEASWAEKASLMRMALHSVRLLGQLTGEVGASESVVASSPYVQRMVREIREALKPFPEALRAVIDRLEEIEVAA